MPGLTAGVPHGASSRRAPPGTLMVSCPLTQEKLMASEEKVAELQQQLQKMRLEQVLGLPLRRLILWQAHTC